MTDQPATDLIAEVYDVAVRDSAAGLRYATDNAPGVSDVLAPAAAAMAVIGAAAGLWQRHVDKLRERLATSYGSDEIDQAAAAGRVARAASDLDAARLQITESLAEAAPTAARTQRQAVSRARDVADELLAGSRRYALDASDPVTRCWQDVHTGCRLVFGLLDALDSLA